MDGAATNAAFAGSIPERYETGLGPVLFAPYADDLVGRAAARVTTGRLLEVACGTGIVTRRLDRALPPGVAIVASDLNEAMVAHARTRSTASARVEWRTADAAALPFRDGEFDAVVCQFGLMFVPDKAAAFREARRVVREGGHLLFNVWCRMEENPFASIAHGTIASFFRGAPPTFYQVPFGFHDADRIARHLRDAGFVDVAIERVERPLVAATAAEFARGLVEGNPVSHAIREAGLAFEPVVAKVTAALVAAGGAAPFRSTMAARVVTARAGLRS